MTSFQTASGADFDVLIIGGGIAGAAAAKEISSRGLRTALFEKNEFGSATSSKSSKLIHGGLRYLETAWFAMAKGRWGEAWKNFKFVCFSLRESRRLARMFPELIHPIALAAPFYPSKDKNLFLMITGCLFYGVLGKLLAGSRFPNILWSKRAVLKEIPQLLPENLLGGVILYDHTADDRALVEALVRSAAGSGAQMFERAQAVSCVKSGNSWKLGVSIQGEVKFFTARTIVNASGPWADETRRILEPGVHENMIVPVAGSHLEFKRFLDRSMVLEAEDGRIFFVINRNGVSRVGTTERPEPNPENAKVSEEEIEYLLKQLEHFFPGLSLKRKDILHSDCGIRPLAKPEIETRAHEISREHAVRKTSDGLYHLLGVKITDHRRAALDLTAKILQNLH